MSAWFSLLRAAPAIEERRETKIEYLGEKTGPVEDDLKKALLPVLQKYSSVERAYLAIISTDGRKSWSVALCFACTADERLAREAGEVFHAMFGKDQFLDMLFVSDDTENELRKVCPPFYTKKNA